MTGLLPARAMGADLVRIDGPAKVTGNAHYAYEHAVSQPAYLHLIQATIARGRVTAIAASAAERLSGELTLLTYENAPRLQEKGDRELAVLQDNEVAFRGQLIGAVLAETLEIAREAASLVRVVYDESPHDVEFRTDRDDLYRPERVNPSLPTDTIEGDPESALARGPVRIDEVYRTPMEHNNPMEPHATIAVWAEDGLTLYDSTQGVHSVRTTVAALFGLAADRVRVIAPYVGGGFGSKGMPHAHVVLAAMAARVSGGRPVKLALTRQQMFALVGYRTPTVQRVRLAAEHDGRLTAIAHDVIEQTSKIKEFAEQTAAPTRMMYAAPSRRTTHRLAALDVAVPSWMRAPGECPGMFAPEVAMDELAVACSVDPVELRIRNEPSVEPGSGLPFSSRNLVSCLREGARRFGWERRDPAPGVRRENGWLVGVGMASSTYPVHRRPGSAATIRFDTDGHYLVEIGAVEPDGPQRDR
jgi:xanthine dehydrogenase YagR molybdenum-binding subunit